MQGLVNGTLSFLIGACTLSLISTVQKTMAGYPIIFEGYLIPVIVGGGIGLIFGLRRLKLKEKEDNLARLNLVLRNIRNVDHLLVKENDLKKLLQGICNILIENRGYYNAWIAVLDDSNRLITIAETGIGEEFSSMVERLKQRDLTDCIQKALSQPGLVISKNPSSACTDCPLSEGYAGRGAITARLEHAGKVYGILTISIPKEVVLDKEEQGLVAEIARDIAFAIEKIGQREKRLQMESYLQKSRIELEERVKELNCLFGISRLVEKRANSLEQILQGTVELIPLACQYPEIASSRIMLDGQEFKTSNFKKSIWKLAIDIIVHGKTRGILEVYYHEERSDSEEGPFLIEEKSLMNAIAERLGRIIERKQSEAALRESEQRFRNLIENSLTGISIVQDDRIVYQNPEQERLFGPIPRATILASVDDIYPDDIKKVKQLYEDIKLRKAEVFETDFRFYPKTEKAEKRNLIWVNCRASLIEYHGKNAILVNVVDVTRTKELENLVRIQDKMASLGRVAAGIAHEIRNPLSGINIYLNTLEKIYNRDGSLDKVSAILEQLQSASNKIESVIKRVMDFAKPSEPKFVLTDINKPLDEAINLSSVTLRKSGIEIETTLAENLPLCHADLNLIEEVVLNLITNAAEALKHMEENKKIMIESSYAKGCILLVVSDSGPGVPLNIRDKIFDPFYTTKPEGSGIGLSLSQRIITDHGGSMVITDSKWGGAEFRIEIPIKEPNT